MKNTLVTAFLAAASLAAGAALAHGEGAKGAAKKPAAQKIAEADKKAFGQPGDPRKVTRTVSISMNDKMRFEPASLQVKAGETIRIRARNNGRLMHELVLGTMKDLKEHAEIMRKNPGMEHDEPYIAHVSPGKTGTIVWQFTNAGEYNFACLVAGHMEAGMLGKLAVK